MKVIFHISKRKSGQVGVEEIVCEDVSSYEFTENQVVVKYNTGKTENFAIRDNGNGDGEWFEVGTLITRAFMKVGKSLGGTEDES